MRCLRQLTKEQLKATIFLSKENYDTLDDELRKIIIWRFQILVNPQIQIKSV